LTLALVQLRHARLRTGRFIIDDGSGTSILAAWGFVQRYGPADDDDDDFLLADCYGLRDKM